MTVLLDGNVLIALTVQDHVHHDAAATWFAANDGPFATTPITEGMLLRFLLRAGLEATDALGVLGSVTEHEHHSFWADDLPFDATTLRGVVGHRQVTDAYLVELARAREGQLATFDRGLAALRRDAVELLET